MTPTRTSLPFEQREQTHRHFRVAALDRHLIDTASGKCGEYLLVLPPFGAECRLPVHIRLDAVAVADMDGGLAFQARACAMQSLDAPLADFRHVNVEGRLIELDHIDAIGFERAQLPGSANRRRRKPFHPVAVVVVGDRIDDRHRAGQGEFQLALGMLPRGLGLEACTRPLSRNCASTVGTIAL